MIDVTEFVRSEAALPFAWGERDCSTTADRWVRQVTGFSPLARFGRVYKTEIEAREWLREPGGIAVAVNRVMRSCGFQKTAEPKAGDVGLVIWGGRLFVGIHSGVAWFSRDENGLIGAPLDAVWKAWRIS